MQISIIGDSLTAIFKISVLKKQKAELKAIYNRLKKNKGKKQEIENKRKKLKKERMKSKKRKQRR